MLLRNYNYMWNLIYDISSDCIYSIYDNIIIIMIICLMLYECIFNGQKGNSEVMLGAWPRAEMFSLWQFEYSNIGVGGVRVVHSHDSSFWFNRFSFLSSFFPSFPIYFNKLFWVSKKQGGWSQTSFTLTFCDLRNPHGHCHISIP